MRRWFVAAIGIVLVGLLWAGVAFGQGTPPVFLPLDFQHDLHGPFAAVNYAAGDSHPLEVHGEEAKVVRAVPYTHLTLPTIYTV